jgi:hypothetical protein
MDDAQQQMAVHDEQGRPVASADVELVDDSLAQASFHVEPGHIEPGTRERLVDEVLDSPEVSARDQVRVVIPIGDTELLDRVRERSTSSEVRAAGASCLIDAELPEGDPGPS